VEGVTVHRIPWSLRKWLRFIRTPFDLFSVLYAQRNNYDIIHLHQFSWFSLFAILAARILGKLILTKLPNVGEYGIPGLGKTRFGFLKIAILKLSDALVAMSKESLKELNVVGFPGNRVLATPNGIRIFKGETASRTEIHTDAKLCRIVFVGRLSEEKAIEDLLFAWAEVVNAGGHSAELELWGGGQLEPKLKQLSKNLGIQNSVIFRGHVETVRERLEVMDIFILPSRVEGNSNAVLEAMAAGLPIISTRVGGTPMLVGLEGDRFLVNVGDRVALTKCLLELIRDNSLRKRLGAVMRQRVVDHFDIKLVARTYASAYQLLIIGERNQISEISNPVVTEI
jgi:glycosyltransferase involved in cell wall biosynthesis